MGERQASNRLSLHLWLPALQETAGGIQSFSQALLRAILSAEVIEELNLFVKNDRRVAKPAHATSKMRARGYGRWPRGVLRTIRFAAGVFFAAARSRPDLIIVGHANFAPLAAIIRRLTGIPIWIMIHGVEVWEEKGRVLAPSLRRADRLLSVSHFTRSKVITEQRLDESRISLLPCTFDQERFRPEVKSLGLLTKLGIPSDRKIILTICRLAEDELNKGYDQIIEALPAVLALVQDAHYLLVGGGTDADRVRSLVEQMGLRDRVTLAGFVADDQLVDYYNSCDVFAMPSSREGFGIVFLEALACGKPVVGGNKDGAVDALCGGELGVLINPDNVTELADTLIALLRQKHPHPLVFLPRN